MTPTAAGPTPVTYGHDPSIARWSVRQYQRMIEEGILTPDDKVELLDGWIVWKGSDAPRPAPATTPETYGRDPALATFTVDQYRRMVETGILGPNDPVELLENWVVLKMPRDPEHDSTLQRIVRPFFRLLPPTWDLRNQSAVALEDATPEPDLAVVRGGADDYRHRHPGPAEIGLLIEVAYSSVLRDRRDKARLYARASVARYWIVNLIDECIEVSEQPSGPTADPGYASVTTHRRGDSVPLILDGVTVATIAVDDVLP